MKLKINNPAPDKQSISKICFEDNVVVLQGQNTTVLAYNETDFRLVVHLRVGTSFAHRHREKGICYAPEVHFISFEFTSNNFTYQVNHAGKLNLCFELFDQKYPFKQFSFEFKNHQNDPLTVKLAQRITSAFNDHLKYGLHDGILYPHARSIGITPDRVYYNMQDNSPQSFIGKILLVGILTVGILFPAGLLYYLSKQGMEDILSRLFAIFAGALLLGICGYILLLIKANQRHRKLQQLKKKSTITPN